MKGVMAWIDERFPLSAIIRHELTDYPVPRNLNYWWNFGSLAGLMLVIQIATGLFLAMHYKPDIGMAFDSIEHMMRDVNYGWLLRYIHSTGASAFFAVIFLHMGRTLYYGCYRKPRELMMWTGQILLLLVMGAAFMGYLLPWGQMSYWGAAVITNLFGALPIVGESIVVLLRGDFVVGDATLTRFFILHYLIPFLIAGMVIIHLVALHTVKSSNPEGVPQPEKDAIPFHPYYTMKDFLGVCIFLIIFLGLVFYSPSSFIMPDNNVPADAMKTPPSIVPEWYFLPFYAILRAIPEVLTGVIAMGVATVIFAALPFLDRSRIPGGGRFRPIYRWSFAAFILVVIALAWLGGQAAEEPYVTLSRILSVLYFAFFLSLPWVSKWEEKWLLQRGTLPKEVLDYMEAEEKKATNGGQS